VAAPWAGITAADTGTGATVNRVEEDWVLVTQEPNAAVASPQVSTQMAAAPSAARFVNFHVNHGEVPD
jgi:hypothetical protein